MNYTSVEVGPDRQRAIPVKKDSIAERLRSAERSSEILHRRIDDLCRALARSGIGAWEDGPKDPCVDELEISVAEISRVLPERIHRAIDRLEGLINDVERELL